MAKFKKEADRLLGVQIDTGYWSRDRHVSLVGLLERLVAEAGG
jgi:hypothetical protein